MKFSSTTIIVPDFPKKQNYLAYNTRTQAFVKLESELYGLLRDFYGSPESMQKKYENEIKTLYEMGILSRDENDDEARVHQHFNQLKEMRDTRMLSVTILTTYNCNFQCVYCFESAARRKVSMTLQTSDNVVDWIIDQVVRHEYQNVYLTFYGGEPLLNTKAIDAIVGRLQPWCHAMVVGFHFCLQTNGFLLTSGIVRSYLPRGLKYVQISLDGLPHIHNKNRPLVSGGGTFDRIIENIILCSELVRIGLSISYSRGDLAHVEPLLEFLDGVDVLAKIDKFMFGPIHPSLGPKDNIKKIHRTECLIDYDPRTLAKATLEIKEIADKWKIKVNIGLAVTLCSLTQKNSGATIDPEGNIYKCNLLLGYPEFAAGHVNKKEFNEVYHSFVNMDVWKKCPPDCAYLPVCIGGCRVAAFLRHGDFSCQMCHKEYLDIVTPVLIKQEYMTGKK